jgi:hypothetical protein
MRSIDIGLPRTAGLIAFKITLPRIYEEVMDIAEISSVLDLIVEFKASVEDSPTIAIFNGDENVETVRRVFLCTSREVLLVELEMFPGWDTEAQKMLDAYVRACG